MYFHGVLTGTPDAIPHLRLSTYNHRVTTHGVIRRKRSNPAYDIEAYFHGQLGALRLFLGSHFVERLSQSEKCPNELPVKIRPTAASGIIDCTQHVAQGRSGTGTKFLTACTCSGVN